MTDFRYLYVHALAWLFALFFLQAVNGSGNWASALTEICDAINNQTHESLPAGVTPMQLMFFRKPNSRKSQIVLRDDTTHAAVCPRNYG